MANLNIKIPAVSESFYQKTEVPQIKSKLNAINSSLGSIIDNTSRITKVPGDIITSFIWIESAGKSNAVNANAVGLMQVGTNAATEIISKEHLKGRLKPEEEAILIKHLGKEKVDRIKKMKNGAKEFYITKEDLFKPELNILIGSIFLGQLIAEETFGSNIRMDKVVLRYNRGYYFKNRGKDIKGDVNQVLTQTSGISKDYIVKLLGVNGTLDILA